MPLATERASSSLLQARYAERLDGPVEAFEHELTGRLHGGDPFDGCRSWFGAPSKTTLRAQVEAAITFASDIWPASSTNRTPSRAFDTTSCVLIAVWPR